MEKIVEKYLENKNLLNEKNTFVIAFSGGFDSIAMANIFIELSEKYGFKIVLAHLNHNWRGKISSKEAQNCENFAIEKKVEFYSEILSNDVPHTETAARIERYKFFEKAAQKYNTNKVFTAHTKSDNIETILQRIIKGTGISGLQGIPEIRQLEHTTIYRPLLECSRKDILKYCKNKKLKPNNDNSNQDTKYFRNKIRRNLLPYLKENYDENIENALTRLIKNAKDAEQIIQEYEKKELSNIFAGDTILTKEFLKLIQPVKNRIIKKIFENNNLDYDQKRINEINEFIEIASKSKAGKTFSLGTNQWLYSSSKKTEVIDKTVYNDSFVRTELKMEGETYLKEFDAVIRITKWDKPAPTKFPPDNSNIMYADFSNTDFPLTLRTRKDGDIITPFGHNTPIKLKKYLNNKGLSKQDKSKVLLISSTKEVIWVINLGISNNVRVQNVPTHKVEFYKRSEHG